MSKAKNVQGYRVLATIGKKFAIACNPKATEPWVIWRIDRDGDYYSGEYMSDKRTAVARFRQLGFQGVI